MASQKALDLYIFKISFLTTRVWVCACERKHPFIVEESDRSGVGLRGGCKPPDVGAGNQTWSSA